MTATETDNSALARLARAATMVAGAALLGMAATEAWQVFARYVLNDSPGWTEPVALLLLNTAMSLGAAAGVRSWSHFGFFILVHNLPPGLRHSLQAFACLVVAAVGAALAVWGAQLLLDGIAIPAAGTVLPESAVFLPMALGGALMFVFAIERLFAPAPETAAEA
ncbi:MAG TPA: TRAP transporter small permease subunit [Rhodanobacteraceae bacterium]|jgi:TRAP-type C4-dicarboxylate transport system permease small subunit|nr:TRAP transporter small permease subunit [Rhodanobacteraceae bacterium]